MASPLPVVAAVIRRGDQILVTRRPLDKARPGLWEFPGGKIGADEAPQDALVREIQEELGCTIVVGDLLATVTHDYPDLTVHLQAFAATLLIGEPWALEPLAICWTAPAGLTKIALSEADRQLTAAIAFGEAISRPPRR
jgi:8-oxo-dGTP diphosphatase